MFCINKIFSMRRKLCRTKSMYDTQGHFVGRRRKRTRGKGSRRARSVGRKPHVNRMAIDISTYVRTVNDVHTQLCQNQVFIDKVYWQHRVVFSQVGNAQRCVVHIGSWYPKSDPRKMLRDYYHTLFVQKVLKKF